MNNENQQIPKKRLKLQGNYFGFVNLNGRYSFSDNYESFISEQDYLMKKTSESSFFQVKTQNSFEINNKSSSVLQSFQNIVSQNKIVKLQNSKASSDKSQSPDFFNSTIKHLIENSFENNDYPKRKLKPKINIKKSNSQNFFQKILFQKKLDNKNLQRQDRSQQLQNCDQLQKFEISKKNLQISGNFQYSFVQNQEKKQTNSCNKSTKSTFFQSMSPGVKKLQSKKNIMQEFLQKNSYYNRHRNLDKYSHIQSFATNSKFLKKATPNKQKINCKSIKRKCRSQKDQNKNNKKLHPIKNTLLTQKLAYKNYVSKPLLNINIFKNHDLNRKRHGSLDKKKSQKSRDAKNQCSKENNFPVQNEQKCLKQQKKKKRKIKYLPYLKDQINFQQFFYTLVQDKQLKIYCEQILALKLFNHISKKQGCVYLSDLLILANVFSQTNKKKQKFQSIVKAAQAQKVSHMQVEQIEQIRQMINIQNFFEKSQKLLVTLHLNGNQQNTLRVDNVNEIPQAMKKVVEEQNLSETQQQKLLCHLWNELA